MDLPVYVPKLSEKPLAVPAVRVACFVEQGANFSSVIETVMDYLALVPKGINLKQIVPSEDEVPQEDESVVLLDIEEDFSDRLFKRYNELMTLEEDNDFTLYISAPVEDGATGYSVEVTMALTPEEDFPNWRDAFYFDFALELVKSSPELIAQFARAIAQRFPNCTLTASASLNAACGLGPALLDEMNSRLFKFIGLDASYEGTQYRIGKKLLQAAWLTYVNVDHMSRIEGEDSLKAALVEKAVSRVGSGLIIRAARLPPIGNVNRNAPDVGFLPTIDSLLRDVISHEPAVFRRLDKDEVDHWFHRFHKIQDGDWENEELVPY
jgi:hypothetical protein